MPIVEARKVSKTYRAGEVAIPALSDVTFDIETGSFVSFVGPSGSGKTTLLNLIGWHIQTLLATDVAPSQSD